MQQEHPPAYTHEPDTFQLPSVPQHELPSISNSARQHLPGIKSLDLPYNPQGRPLAPNGGHGALDPNLNSHSDASQWHYPNALLHTTFPQVPSTVPRSSTEEGIGSPMDDVKSVLSVEDQHNLNGASVISMDDPDVRLAAEALSGLGNPDFVRSPPHRNLTLSRDHNQESEPLLELITSNHPWLGGTINGSISAYETTKSYTPRFVQYGAELLERNIGSPVVNTVSSVGRRTGVEQNLRRYLGGHRRPSDLEQGDTADSPDHKRRRVMNSAGDPMDLEGGLHTPRTRGGSQSSYPDSLPAYDENKSPKYEEAVVAMDTPQNAQDQGQAQSQDCRGHWSAQLVITASGLGVALSEASLKSLKACLGLLGSATSHVGNVMRAMKQLLEDYERALQARQQSDGQSDGSYHIAGTTSSNSPPEMEERVRTIADRMKELGNDIWKTLQKVVASVSRYTGGALPENARLLVRSQLMSVPQRWQLAQRSTARDQRGEEVRYAHRMLAFAKEGLDMIAQVSTVIGGTIESAEIWLERMGKGRREEGEASVEKGKEGDRTFGQQTQTIDYAGEKSRF
ncbi:Opi1-domain-containing protein [Lepidopterella palustris CBS 459.81]|uniref:Opi1-domain-containing protein n=1 Tax=Lepidopterella palustris CBS 459.81 TaxID=1314670 RepID=A0A8E2EGG6_9PEZI|nr:Opi1-domain-containing protein [Lepidopterella palustris CBS 459.81]